MTKKFYVSFALADSMFNGKYSTIERQQINEDLAKNLINSAKNDGTFTPCFNPSHVATLEAIEARFSIHLGHLDKPPVVQLNEGDILLVIGVRGLPRLTDRHEYTSDEIAKATFNFTVYNVTVSFDETKQRLQALI